MDETFTTKAIVLDRQPFRESDLKIAFYGLEHGRIDLVARGAKKFKSKLAPHLEPMNLVNIMGVKGKKLNYVGSAVNENCFLNIKNDLSKIFYASKALALVKKTMKVGEMSDTQEVFSLLNDFFSVLNQENISSQLLYNFFILKFLSLAGYTPELYQCLHCKNKILPGNNFFDFGKGGLVCGRCPQGQNLLKISDDCIKILRLALDSDFFSLNKVKIEEKLIQETTAKTDLFCRYQFN